MIFFLGTHQPYWLNKVQYPLFISARRLRSSFKKKTPIATCKWALDSGGFTELNKYGTWTISEKQYIEEIKKYQESIGNLQWAAAQDWMCEPFVLEKTQKTIKEHQQLTIENFLNLKNIDADLPIIPVLQ